ncbi:MAG: LCP family protein [Oscillospiraceae bacterium]|jgi:LCP family protein required for cell wall assembly|nr:LCP family protein [Oscillospiraceae bacterium]
MKLFGSGRKKPGAQRGKTPGKTSKTPAKKSETTRARQILKMRRIRAVAVSGAISLAIVFLAALGYAKLRPSDFLPQASQDPGRYNPSNPDASFDPDATPDPALPSGAPGYITTDGNKRTFVILGTDQLTGSLTDVMMIASLDLKSYTMNIVSIPRDTLVNAEGTYRKANGIYQIKKGETADQRIERLMTRDIPNLIGFNPDFYFVVSVAAFPKLVDAIGGVDFYVPQTMKYSDPGQNLYINLAKGQQHLNGAKALQLVRFREGYANKDIGRIGVTQDFLLAAAKQMLAKSKDVSKLKLADIILNDAKIKTNLSSNDITKFAQEMLKIDAQNIHFETMAGTGEGSTSVVSGHGSFVIVYVNEWLEQVNRLLNPLNIPIKAEHLSIVTKDTSGKLFVTDGKWIGDSWGSGGTNHTPVSPSSTPSTQSPASPAATPKPAATATPKPPAATGTPSASPGTDGSPPPEGDPSEPTDGGEDPDTPPAPGETAAPPDTSPEPPPTEPTGTATPPDDGENDIGGLFYEFP